MDNDITTQWQKKPKKLILRTCNTPLTPAHLIAVLKDEPQSGFGEAASTKYDDDYKEIIIGFPIESIAENKGFNHAIEGMIYQPTLKRISKLTPKNQFMALAPTLTICEYDQTNMTLATPLMTPFIIDFPMIENLQKMRATFGDLAVSQSRMAGFLESNIGTVAILFAE